MIDENSRNYKPMFEYIPQVSNTYMARRFAMGAEKHGAWSYTEQEEAFYRDRIKHGIAHAQAWLDGDTSDPDHMAGAICDLAIAIYGIEKLNLK